MQKGDAGPELILNMPELLVIEEHGAAHDEITVFGYHLNLPMLIASGLGLLFVFTLMICAISSMCKARKGKLNVVRVEGFNSQSSCTAMTLVAF